MSGQDEETIALQHSLVVARWDVDEFFPTTHLSDTVNDVEQWSPRHRLHALLFKCHVAMR